MNDSEFFVSLKKSLVEIKSSATNLLNEIQEIESCSGLERVQRCQILRTELFNSRSEFFGFADKASAFEYEIDDGIFWSITKNAIQECADEGIIDADSYGFNGFSPAWHKALFDLLDLSLPKKATI